MASKDIYEMVCNDEMAPDPPFSVLEQHVILQAATVLEDIEAGRQAAVEDFDNWYEKLMAAVSESEYGE